MFGYWKREYQSVKAELSRILDRNSELSGYFKRATDAETLNTELLKAISFSELNRFGIWANHIHTGTREWQPYQPCAKCIVSIAFQTEAKRRIAEKSSSLSESQAVAEILKEEKAKK